MAEFYETYESVITKTVLCKLYESVITKTGNDHERAQTTTSGHPWTSNQKSNVLFLPPISSSYKDHPDFENDWQSLRGNCFLLSQYLCGASKLGAGCYGRLNS